jgi:S1-C subfamily serine protease
VARFERQVGSLVAPQRTDTALRKKDGTVAGPVRYRVSKPAFDAAVELYAATTTGFGLTVARFFPTLEASTRTEGEVMVVAMMRGLGLRAGAKEGDVIIAVDGRPVASPDAFGKLVREAAVPGSTVALTVESAGTRRVLKVVIPRVER